MYCHLAANTNLWIPIVRRKTWHVTAPTGTFSCSEPSILCHSGTSHLCDEAAGLVPVPAVAQDLVRLLHVATGNSSCPGLEENIICWPCSLLLLWHLLSD